MTASMAKSGPLMADVDTVARCVRRAAEGRRAVEWRLSAQTVGGRRRDVTGLTRDQLVADVRAVDLNHRKRAAVSIVPLPEQLDAPTFHDLGEPMLRLLGQFGFVSALTVDLRSVDVENAHGLRPAGQPQPYRISVPDPDFRRLAGQHAKHDLNDNVAVHHHLQSLRNTDRHDPDRSAGLIRIVGSSCEDNSVCLVERPTMRGWTSPFGPGCRQS